MTAGTLAESADFREAAEAAQAAYQDANFEACVSGCAKVRTGADSVLECSEEAAAEGFSTAGSRGSRS